MNEQLSLPTTRRTDPPTSHRAAESVRPAQPELEQAIRRYVAQYPYSTQFEIASGLCDIHGDRWDEGTIRSACKRAGLERADLLGVSPRGRDAARWILPTQDTRPL